MPRAHVTIADVARATGASVATVSRALREQPEVSAETRRRIIRTARRLGYVPNRAARSLVVRATQTLGLLIPDGTDPIHGQVATGFEQEATSHGYSVLLANGFDNPIQERSALRVFAMHRADGIALMGSVLSQREARTAVRPSPVVFVNGEHPSLAGYEADLSTGCLRADDPEGIKAVVQHLLDSGYRKLVYVGGPGSASDLTRRDTMVRALAEARAPRPRILVSRSGGWESVDTVAAAVAQSRPDAVVCYDDKLALRLLDALRVYGIMIPRDMALVGFDDIPFARLANPRLTTVAQPSVEMGRLAAAMLLRAIHTGVIPPSVRLPVRLVIRESTTREAAQAGGKPGDRPAGTLPRAHRNHAD
ncbi:MAG: LacI family DNA-binding transcriptional regulator [Armatimonadota bacterium]|nr:LacI family DNA-binding transcriptional regulator [Armatimonadota bacterium]